tara:strand:- start:18193 stop:19224 length:1032 start_codon:yes stop_codon:yes gene_type:complete
MIKTTKAAVLFKLNSKLKLINVKLPKLYDDQVLVKILYTSICRSQLMEIYSGRNNRKWLPHLMGHEGVGKIIDLGNKVKNFKIGDEVILTWISDNKIKRNTKLNYKNKIINAGNVTTFSQYSIVSKYNIVKKPINLKNNLASLLGCCFATGQGMVFNETNPTKNSKILLIGLGGVGLGILLALKEKKIKNVFLVEKDKKKIDIAKKLGFLNYTKGILKKDELKIANFFEGKADICYESAGSTKTIEFGISMVKHQGHFHFASHPESSKKIKIYPHEIISGKKISGSWGGGCKPKRDFTKFANIIKKNAPILNKIFYKKYKLKEINLAIKNFKNNKDFRPLIKM